MQKIVAHWSRLPEHLRRGLLRLYVAVSVPWVAWFGYQLLYALNDYDQDEAANAFWWLLVVPVGSPILFLVIAWVVTGFRKRKLGVDKAPDDKAVSQSKLEDKEAASQKALVMKKLAIDAFKFALIWSVTMILLGGVVGIAGYVLFGFDRQDQEELKGPIRLLLIFISSYVSALICLYWTSRKPTTK